MSQDSSANPDRRTRMDTARRFSDALDREDYTTAEECLDTACRYRIDTDLHEGPEAILASYRESGDWASATLDGIRYESLLREEGDHVVVTYLDHLEHAGRFFTHRCEQVLEFGKSERIAGIEHRHLPGEREALGKFFAEVGLVSRSRKIEGESQA